MPHSIQNTTVRLDTRANNSVGMIIVDFTWDDGAVWQVAFELGPDDDMTARLQELTSRAEIQRAADEAEGGA